MGWTSHWSRKRWVATVCLTVLPLMLAAVSLAEYLSRNPLKRQAVSGKVTFDGKPLDHGMIEFWPEGSGEGRVTSGTVITEGTYQIEMLQGLPPGKYRVRIFSPEGNPDDPVPTGAPGPGGKPGVERIPAQYNVKSDLTLLVVAGELAQFDIDIKRPDPPAQPDKSSESDKPSAESDKPSAK